MKKANARRVISAEKFVKVMQAEWRKQWRALRKSNTTH